MTGAADPPDATLLAVDLGLRAGLALYGRDGRLRWYRSSNFGSPGRLKKGAYAVVRDIPTLRRLYVEGDRAMGEVWGKAAAKGGAVTRLVSAEIWREVLLHDRERRRGTDAKRHADRLARTVIEWSGAPRPTSLRHDAAEAILVGLYGVLDAGWLEKVPPGFR